MGGGVAMRAAAKVAGINVFNTTVRGGENPVVSAARRSVASVVSNSDELKLSVNGGCMSPVVEKVCEGEWEFASVEEDELFMEGGEPMPRLVFGGVPSVQEARQATSDLNYALEKTYLHPSATSESEYVSKPCLVSESLVAPLPSKNAIQAFRLLNENPKAQTVVASIASDPNVWNAVFQNPDLVNFLQTHKTDVAFAEMDSDESDATDDEKTEATGESKAESGKGFMDYVEKIKQKISVTVVDMMNSLADTFQSFFGWSPKDGVSVNPDGTAGINMEQTVIGASLMGLAIMVISVVVLKRS
ncbi:uncharacterized protein LOC143537270 [Bidens hawaiensis]|uniref:uncharacterized protein LOC143537270 n=1 Tax=Bidens hawaiensis TaxID=980011 RepID=UPI00404A5987